MPQTYTVKQVAEILDYSTNSIYTFLKEKRIKGVRVGKGRFRIPQEELNRLLHLSKSKKSQELVNSSSSQTRLDLSSENTGLVEPNEPSEISIAFGNLPQKLSVPSIFEWFVGLSSILMGTAMFLFNGFLKESSIQSFTPYIFPIKISFIAGGLGLLITDIFPRQKKIWHVLFHLLLTLNYGLFAFILFRIADWDGAILHGITATVLLFSLFTSFGGVATFSIYTVFFALLVPLSILFESSRYLYFPYFDFLSKNLLLFVSLWTGISLCGVILVWWSYYRKKILFFSVILIYAIFLVILSIWYANTLYWGRAVFILMLAFINILLPIWTKFNFQKTRDRYIVLTAFGTVLFFFLILIGILQIIQTNIISYTQEQLENKVKYGKIDLEQTFASAQNTLETAATNSLTISTIKNSGKKTDAGALQSASKNIFEVNKLFSRVIILSHTGDVLSVYPYTRLTESNLSYRNYYQEAVKSKKTYISELFAATTDDKRQVIVIATPVVDKDAKEEVIAVIIGSIDLDILNNKLQQIAVGKKQEYFVVADKMNKRIIHPNPAYIGTELESANVFRSAYQGKKEAQGYNSDGVYVLQAYAYSNSLGMAIAVAQPFFSALSLTFITTLIIFFIGITLVCVLAFLLFIHTRKAAVFDTS